METHCDDSCQQHRGKYQYIADDLISHTIAVVQVDVEGTHIFIDVCGGLGRDTYSLCGIVLLCYCTV